MGQSASSNNDLLLKVVVSRSGQRILPVEFKCFGERFGEAFNQLLMRAFLAIHAGHFLNPADPPLAPMLHNSRIFHVRSFPPARRRRLRRSQGRGGPLSRSKPDPSRGAGYDKRTLSDSIELRPLSSRQTLYAIVKFGAVFLAVKRLGRLFKVELLQQPITESIQVLFKCSAAAKTVLQPIGRHIKFGPLVGVPDIRIPVRRSGSEIHPQVPCQVLVGDFHIATLRVIQLERLIPVFVFLDGCLLLFKPNPGPTRGQLRAASVYLQPAATDRQC